MKISATIVTLNEERNIARAMASLKPCVDETVVVDSGSSDQTREIAARMGARVVREEWRGYAEQKNFAAACAAHDWILSIDADEELTPELAAEIQALRATGERDDVGGWAMPRRARYLGRWIWHSGWYPDAKIRLYHRARGAWKGERVHESVEVAGAVGALRNDLLHFTCDSIGQHLRTLDRYTSLAAQAIQESGKPVGVRRLVIDPPWTFVRSYFFQRGFLDGTHGFVIAAMAAFYTFVKYAKAREMTR
ncbi:MAG TPA: glycosyltransferase family 2 protein [Bryobacteraceae bacterium]|jgi:glycosyltransferase involved in cell wall biosynthesis|nr:glycosyltransferase family 2 protein [Bryobacteraceae bacterium]